MSNPVEHKQVDFEIKLEAGKPDGSFSGYGSVFNYTDSGGDDIKQGAFKRTLREWSAKGKMPKMLLQHGGGWAGGAQDMVPIGVWEKMSEDKVGLYAEGRLIAMDTDRGKMIYAGLKEGVLDGLSIGYRAVEVEYGNEKDEPSRTIKDLDLMELSVVLFGMNDKALIDAVKSSQIDDIKSLADAERFLRETGAFSRKAATEFVSRIKKLPQREAEGMKAAEDLLATLRQARLQK